MCLYYIYPDSPAFFLDPQYDSVDWEEMLDCLEQLGLRGWLGAFLEELYSGVECEVKVGKVLSDPFEVTTGLREGRILSLLLLSLCINGITVALLTVY